MGAGLRKEDKVQIKVGDEYVAFKEAGQRYYTVTNPKIMYCP